MSDALALDLSNFTAAIKIYQEATKKEIPVILNRAARNFAFRCIDLTPKGNAAKIEGELRTLVGTQTHGKSGRALKKPKPITKPSSLGRAATARRVRRLGQDPRTMGREAFEAAIRKTIGSRLSGVAYLRAAWLAAAFKFGVKSAAGTKVRSPRIGSGLAADTSRAAAELVNHASREYVDEATRNTAIRAMQIALDATAADMRAFAQAKLAEAAAKAGLR